MPEYVRNSLKHLFYKPLILPQYSLHEYARVNWINKNERQYAQYPDNIPFLSKEDTTYVQEVVEVFLYYARALDITMLPDSNKIVSQQAQPT